MGSSGTVLLKDIWMMLDVCARGWSKTATDHHWRVSFGGRVYPTPPLGPHGRRENSRIQVGHVRRMARFFEILPCARERLPQLG